MKDRV